MDVASPIPLSRLFDFDQGDEGSDQIVLNESERQYQQKLRDEFDAGFKDLKDSDPEPKGQQNGDHAHDHGFPQRRRSLDSEEDEIRIDDDDEEDRLSERMYRNSRLPPPPPPPPMGPPSIKHLPSALQEAQSTYAQIEYNIYRGPNTGNSPVDDCLPCQCKYNPRKSYFSVVGVFLILAKAMLYSQYCPFFCLLFSLFRKPPSTDRDPRWKACGPDCINRNLLVECIEDDCPCGSYCLNRR